MPEGSPCPYNVYEWVAAPGGLKPQYRCLVTGEVVPPSRQLGCKLEDLPTCAMIYSSREWNELPIDESTGTRGNDKSDIGSSHGVTYEDTRFHEE